MKKESHYFPHDCNARNDEKLLAVRMRYGAEGYGIYFMIIERLRDSSEYFHVADYNIIAFDLRVETGRVKSIIEDFGLFVFTDDGKYFYSETLLLRMKPLDNLRNQRINARLKTKEQKNENFENSDNEEITDLEKRPKNDRKTTEKRPKNDRLLNKNNKNKENNNTIEKENTEKPKIGFSPPSLEEVKNFILEKQYSVDAESFIAFYQSKGWVVGNSKMKDWKAAIVTWQKRSFVDVKKKNTVDIKNVNDYWK